ncbi:contact-dependent growth inhibition system immunity protein [Streptomyces sp. NPDC055815]
MPTSDPPADPAERTPRADPFRLLPRPGHTRPSAIAEAERQLREYSRNPPGRVRLELGEFYADPDHEAAVADYAATTHPQLVARLVGELHELLALPLDDGDYALAAAELGMEVGPPEPFSHGAWFQSVATALAG